MNEIDVTCGACGGRLHIGPSDRRVRCAECDARLAVPADCPEGAELRPARGNSGQSSSSIHDGDEADLANISVPSSIKAPDFRQWGGIEENGGRSSSGSSVTSAPVMDFSSPEPEAPTANPPETPAATAPRPKRKEDTQRSLESSGRNRNSGRIDDGSGGVSRKAFLGLVIYASIMTALSLGLAFLLLTQRERQLESLPDVVPPRNDEGEIARTLVPAGAELPGGHRLPLGTSRRFGDLLVTPVRITREPLAFTHYRGEETREPVGEVLKLWLRFENVGDAQKAFVPIDRELLFYRALDSGDFKANNFLARRTEGGLGELIPIYDQPIASDWDLRGQELGTKLFPGERLETYAPSETNVATLEGTWVWRLHLRKGIAENGWGVTTLVEVEFDGNDVES